MKTQSNSLLRRRRPSSKAGVALVIVLSFVVILTVLVLAFLSRALLDQQLSQSSASRAKADIFARGALDQIVGDLQQEIVDGSNAVPAGNTTLYVPKTASNYVPARVGFTDATAPPFTLPNLVKVSRTATPFYSGANSNRASSINSATASFNGRSISTARWNKPLLMTPDPANNNAPPASFTAPDWVLVARDGSNPTTVNFGSGVGTTNGKVATNNSYIVGRYAYCVYDEGGLLDANVAGYPSGTKLPQTAYKFGESIADLTQIPNVSQSLQDALTGWRSQASAGITLTFPYTGWGGTGASQYYANLLSDVAGITSSGALAPPSTGFLSPGLLTLTSPVQTTTPSGNPFISIQNQMTDQHFTTRQQMLDLFKAADSTNGPLAAQYFGTFTRDLEQPLIIPPTGRPTTATTNENPSSLNSTFDQNDDNVNPDFLTVLGADKNPVTFKRFPLSRLALFPAITTSNNTHAPASAATAALIMQYFGLTWDSTNNFWKYGHGAPGGSSYHFIYTLAEVAGLNPPRDPDFLEMLKASIVVGSVAKMSNIFGPASTGLSFAIAPANIENGLDGTIDFQIMQIAANIIDQYKSDNYPTRITPATQLSNLSLPATSSGFSAQVFSGDEDLPYFLTDRQILIQTPPSGGKVFPNSQPFNGAIIDVPEVWNPHMVNSNDNNISRPNTFRVWSSAVEWTADNPFPDNSYGPINAGSTTSNVGAYIQFTDSTTGATLYREPYGLAQVNANVSASSAMPAAITDINGKNWIGFYSPGHQNITFPPLSPNGYWAQTTPLGITYHCDYKDASGNWVEYQELITDGSPILGSGSYGASSPWDQLNGYNVLSDPRTSRFETGSGNDPANQVSAGAAPLMFPTAQPSGSGTHDYQIWSSVGGYQNIPNQVGFKTNENYSAGTPSYWFGDFQRNTAVIGPIVNYFADRDGVVRPGIGVTGGTGSSFVGWPNAQTATPTLTTVKANFNRPIILHRPFKSVAELGYAFTGTPWRNIDFSSPQSGSSALLEAFCLNEAPGANGMVAGRLNLNTRQVPVVQSIYSGANVDELNSSGAAISGVSAPASGIIPVLPNGASGLSKNLATALVTRTSSTNSPDVGPIMSRGDLVGHWSSTLSGGSQPVYVGFGGPRSDQFPSIGNPAIDAFSVLSNVALTSPSGSGSLANISRTKEIAVRGLADVGTSRIWNLFIDVVAQTGRYPAGSSITGSQFIVEGERRYWLHVAIDRFTGKIIDQQLEPVFE